MKRKPSQRCLCETVICTDAHDPGKWRVCELQLGHPGRHMTHYNGKRRFWTATKPNKP